MTTVCVIFLSGSAAGAAIHPISGNHRLLDRFIEDGAVVPRGWIELVAGYSDYAGSDRDIAAGTVVAFRFGRNVEAGFLAGAIDRRRSAGTLLYGAPLQEGIDGAGLADGALYGKCRVLGGPLDLALGARVTIPLGDEGAGRGPGVFQYEAFAGMRKTWPRMALVGSAGMTGRGDAKAPGAAEGRASLRAGVGTLIPLSLLWTMMAEITYESARFEGEGDEAEIVAGFDWRPMKFLAARGGAGAGLTDGAAEWSAVLSVVLFF